MQAPLAEKAAEFARELGEVLRASLPQAPSIDVQSVEDSPAFVVQPADATGQATRIPLHVNGDKLAELGVTFYLEWDSSQQYLKIVRTDFLAFSVLDRQPLFRADYRADMNTRPTSHWQFHAERGALTHLLSMAHAHKPKTVRAPHELARLHFPIGGERFRLCIEDIIQFVIEECGVDSVKGWRKAVQAGRERWRRIQLRTVVRDWPAEAADVLRAQGWHVVPPGASAENARAALYRW